MAIALIKTTDLMPSALEQLHQEARFDIYGIAETQKDLRQKNIAFTD